MNEYFTNLWLAIKGQKKRDYSSDMIKIEVDDMVFLNISVEHAFIDSLYRWDGPFCEIGGMKFFYCRSDSVNNYA